jgi:hypothetical protein
MGKRCAAEARDRSDFVPLWSGQATLGGALAASLPAILPRAALTLRHHDFPHVTWTPLRDEAYGAGFQASPPFTG